MLVQRYISMKGCIIMDEKSRKEKLEEMYLDMEKDISNREILNSVNRDRTLITVSIAGLSLSIAFVSNIPDAANIVYPGLIYATWILFALCIISVLFSYISALIALERYRKINKEYYIDDDDNARNKKYLSLYMTKFLNYVSVIIFMLAVILGVIFIIKNSDNIGL